MGSVSSDAVNRYLKQTRELYGDELFLESNSVSEKKDLQTKDLTFPADLDSFHQQIHKCQNCQLGQSRTKFVFGVGDPNASLVLVGEAPGEQEDLKGEPFVGRAGQLLDKILAAIDRSREKDVYICNVLKCRPPQNRDPRSDEVEQCEP